MIITDIDNFEDNVRSYFSYAINKSHQENIYVKYDDDITFVIMTTDELNKTIDSAMYVAKHIKKEEENGTEKT